ncbi:MAG TPA: hypothetical protein PLE45_08035 [Spirochaetota bacterium]|nr:hypothetical protein [Spirochaetota bacterium]
MDYTRPEVIAKNQPIGSYAAGCPEKNRSGQYLCLQCERTK